MMGSIVTPEMKARLEDRKGLIPSAHPSDSDWTEGREMAHRIANREARISLRMESAKLADRATTTKDSQ